MKWLVVFLIPFLGLAKDVHASSCPPPWHCETSQFTLRSPHIGQPNRKVVASIRHGFLRESDQVQFQGNILYFQGLGDSMLNHYPLFSKLTNAGYRVVAFDYQGQGGSSGLMDNTRIQEIPNLGKRILKMHGARSKPTYLLGWSTGGLAAYAAAARGDEWFDGIVLIAPGIAPRAIVGEGLINWPVDEITLETLTTMEYGPCDENPHIDPIKPNTPLAVPSFAADLQWNAIKALLSWKVPKTIPGMVLIGLADGYIYPNATRRHVKERASHFEIQTYEGALHEIDNEIPEIAERAHTDILDFLNRLH